MYGIQSTQNYLGLTVPRSIGVIQPMLLFFAILSIRLLARYILINKENFNIKSLNKKKVLIYGAGDAGRQLCLALENSQEYEVIGFLDDDSQLHRQIILGKVIYSPSKLEKRSSKKLWSSFPSSWKNSFLGSLKGLKILKTSRSNLS